MSQVMKSFRKYWLLWLVWVLIPLGAEGYACAFDRCMSPQIWEIVETYTGVSLAILVVVGTLIVHFWINKSTWILVVGVLAAFGLGFAACEGGF